MTDYEMRLVMRGDTMERARSIIRNDGVQDVVEDGELITASVVDEYSKYYSKITLRGTTLTSASCTCRFSYEDSEHLCAHAVALGLFATSAERMEEKERARVLKKGQEFLRAFVPKREREDSVQLELTLYIGGGKAEAMLRAGISRMYIVKDVHAFAVDYYDKAEIALGKNRVVDTHHQGLSKSDEKILRILDEAVIAENSPAGKSIALNHYQLDRLMGALSDKVFSLSVSNLRQIDVAGIVDAAPEISLRLSEADGGYVLYGLSESAIHEIAGEGKYVLCGDVVYRVPRDVQGFIKQISGKGRRFSYRFEKKDGTALISDVMPTLERIARIKIDEAIAQRIIDEPLRAKVELDSVGGGIRADVHFSYGGIEIDPISGAPSEHEGILRRDYASERAVTGLLARGGFVSANDGAFYISGDEAIYNFVNDALPRLNETAEVFASQELLRMRPRKLPLKGSLRVGARGIEFSMMLEGVEADSMPGILTALRERRKYVRLTDGSFLTLDASPYWDEFAREIEENGTLVGDHIELQAYRTIYLNSLLDNSGLDVQRDEQFRAMTDFTSFESVASPIENLRPYQHHGFNWLRQLYDMSLGGILADDMGLGKTVQMLSAIKYAKEKDGPMTSIIVAPTSLIFNWEKEIQKFAPDLSVAVLEGSGDIRSQQIEKNYGCDVLIVSYAQIRRDIGKIIKYRYRFCVLDEAQNIKNHRSVGAMAVKQIRAKARFALTGTPMENHIGELWSVFDFVLPGYLGGYSQFVQRFADGTQSGELSIKIRPFLMRRLKKDVLSELPDKIEDKVLVEMEDYQQRVYRAMLAKYKADVVAPALGDFGRNRMKILSAITRLRQICCHPSLFLEGYQGGSGKLDVLLGIVQQCAGEGRKMLVFSQFTSMLAIIRESLDQSGIASYYLDGEVPARERNRMCERFNEDDTPVFLISTKAGGTGLNLTGADTVIHFDPWWNPAVEDQATDRAHRIGQQKKVHVLRLIARNTIEEKVADLQLRKKEIVDAVIKPGELMPSSLGREEILSLFD
ncbi:MAG: SNF2-related protein [Christensenellales bacterium]